MTAADKSTPEQYELLKIILDFIAAIVWPLIALIVIYGFKSEIRKLLTRTKKVELPGGFSLETVDQDITQAKVLSTEVEKERTPEIQKIIDEAAPNSETEANKRMIQVGLIPSPSGLSIEYYRKIADTDPRLSLIGLRADLEIMLKNLAKGFKLPIGEKDSASLIISKLLNNGAITAQQYELINTLFKICNSAAHGVLITKEQAKEVLNIGEKLVKDYIAWLQWGFR